MWRRGRTRIRSMKSILWTNSESDQLHVLDRWWNYFETLPVCENQSSSTGAWNKQKERNYQGYGGLQCLCVQVNKKIKKIIFNQNVLGNCTKSRRTRHNCLRKYYWIIYKLYKWRSWTNLNVLTAKRNNHILSFSIWFWAPISEVLLFPHLPTSNLPLRPELTTTFAFLSAKISIRSKYSLSCYFTTGSTFWWQVNFTKENQCATALKAGKEHKTGKYIF